MMKKAAAATMQPCYAVGARHQRMIALDAGWGPVSRLREAL
jgi:hypothetical protein